MNLFVNNEVSYGILQSEDIEESINCLALTFTAGEPMTQHLAITLEDFRVFARPFCVKAVKDRFSVVARSQQTGKVAGCLISEDFMTEPPSGLRNIHPNFEPILSLLTQLDEIYKSQTTVIRDEILHEFLLGVYRDYKGMNIAHNLLKAGHVLGRLKGYKGFIAEATGPVSQHIFIEKNGYRVVGNIQYGEFEFGSVKIFAGITTCKSCKLVYRKVD